ncbi:CASP-like protein 1E2 [Tanacetum coccineum]
METQYKEVEVTNRRSSFNGKDLTVRFLALTLTLIAAVLLGVDKETTIVAITLVPSLPPVDLPVTAKWIHMYFVIANAIACAYAATSLIVILATSSKYKLASLIITILDLAMVALLFSAVGAASSIGVIGYKGNSHVHWDKVCNVFDKFCHQVAIAVFLSFAGSITYLLLIVISALKLHKKF